MACKVAKVSLLTQTGVNDVSNLSIWNSAIETLNLAIKVKFAYTSVRGGCRDS